VDVTENANELTVRLDLSGVNRDQIDLQLTADTLVIRGERPFVRQEGEGYVHLERPYGTFQRSFNLSVPIQPDAVTANFKDGVLTIVLPKQEAVKPRKVEIQTDNQN
jgi:HSP20 family protein